MTDPTRSLREHFRHHRAEQEKEQRSELSPNTWNTPFVTDALLPFCSFIAILHAQSADLADYADYGKYTQTETYTHTHLVIVLYYDGIHPYIFAIPLQLQHISLVILPCNYFQNWISLSFLM